MKRILIYILFIPLLAGCGIETYNAPRDLNSRIGVIEIHRCFCGPSAYRYLIVTQDSNEPMKYNPVNLPEIYMDDNYKIVFSGNMLNDSSIVYTNSPTDAVVEDFRVRNIKLTSIRKCSDLTLNDTLELLYGKTYRNFEKSISIKLDSITEDSRCPYNVECVWAGNAKVKFDFTYNNLLSFFSLNTSTGFRNDTTLSGYEIKLIDLKPYPVYPNPILQRDYTVRIKITR